LVLSLTSHTGHMKNPWIPRLVTLTLMLLAGALWCGVILVALHVSTVVLKTLEMIVDLAAMT
jgi:hypothetical protein